MGWRSGLALVQVAALVAGCAPAWELEDGAATEDGAAAEDELAAAHEALELPAFTPPTTVFDPGTTAGPGIDWSMFLAWQPADEDSRRARDILLNSNRYSLTHWWYARGYHTQSAVYLDLGSNGEHRVRSAGSVALALAVSLQLGLYDEAEVTVSRGVAENIALKLIRSLAYRHRVNYGSSGWGHEWQSSLWALYAGTAGWLMWDRLSAYDAELVRKMVEDEARRLVGFDVGYYRDDQDRLTGRDEDSAAEENAWNAQFLFLAVNLMPTHRERAAWEFKAAELAVSAHARPWDRQSNTAVVSGRQTRHWLVGSNVNADGSVTNHGMFHPDYMATAAYTASAPIWYGLRRAATPDAMFAGVNGVYRSLVDTSWPALYSPVWPWQQIQWPGRIYVSGSPDVFYPQGTDWSRIRRINYAFFDTVARHFGVGNLVAGPAASTWEDLHAGGALALQERPGNENGRTYASAGEDAYASREEWVAAHAALMVLVKWTVAQGAYQRTARFLPVVIDNQDRDCTYVGSWTWDAPAARDSLGDDNRYTAAGGLSGTRVARFKPRHPLPAGRYRVSAWWSAFSNHATDAPYLVRHAGGLSIVRRDQRVNGNRWNSLGTFDFDGTSSTGYVELSNQTSTGYVVADGVMFERL